MDKQNFLEQTQQSTLTKYHEEGRGSVATFSRLRRAFGGSPTREESKYAKEITAKRVEHFLANLTDESGAEMQLKDLLHVSFTRLNKIL
jgi:hypothetical protein